MTTPELHLDYCDLTQLSQLHDAVRLIAGVVQGEVGKADAKASPRLDYLEALQREIERHLCEIELRINKQPVSTYEEGMLVFKSRAYCAVDGEDHYAAVLDLLQHLNAEAA